MCKKSAFGTYTYQVREYQGAPLYTTAQVWVPGGLWRVLLVFKVAKSGIITGLLSAELEPSKTMEKPRVRCFALLLQKLYFVAAQAVQQQSHIKFAWTTTTDMRVWTLHICVCAVCVLYYVCVSVDAYVCWNPTLQLLVSLLCLLLLPYVVFITPSLKLSTLWQTRYNSSRTASLCGPRLTMRLLTWHMRVCCVCCDTCACVYCRCVQVCAFVCWNPTFISFSLIFVCSALVLLLPYNVCITPCLKLSSSLVCGSHGTTAVAQQSCVDHFHA